MGFLQVIEMSGVLSTSVTLFMLIFIISTKDLLKQANQKLLKRKKINSPDETVIYLL